MRGFHDVEYIYPGGTDTFRVLEVVRIAPASPNESFMLLTEHSCLR